METSRAALLLLAGFIICGAFLAFSVGVAMAGPCFVTGDEHKTLTCDFGLELWEEGKKSSRIFQQWNLLCTSRKELPTDCWLERSVVVQRSGFLGTRVSIHNHSTMEGTLRLLTPGWRGGQLNFDVVYQRGERMPVQMRIQSRFNKEAGVFDLESFQAKDVVRSVFTQEVLAQEWRVPEYDYTVNVPMVISGRKTGAEGRRGALIANLSANDRTALKRLESSACLFEAFAAVLQPLNEKLAPLNAQLDNAATTKRYEIDILTQIDAITKDYLARKEVKGGLSRGMEKCLKEAGVSPERRQAVADYFVGEMLPAR